MDPSWGVTTTGRRVSQAQSSLGPLVDQVLCLPDSPLPLRPFTLDPSTHLVSETDRGPVRPLSIYPDLKGGEMDRGFESQSSRRRPRPLFEVPISVILYTPGSFTGPPGPRSSLDSPPPGCVEAGLFGSRGNRD